MTTHSVSDADKTTTLPPSPGPTPAGDKPKQPEAPYEPYSKKGPAEPPYEPYKGV